MKILLAEDDANLSLITRLCLEAMGGHQITLVEDGEAAVNAVNSENFDVILLDGMMPKLSGLDVAKHIRQSNKTSAPIIFLSAKTDEKDISEFRKWGHGYISKPFDPQTICTQIDEILNAIRGKSA